MRMKQFEIWTANLDPQLGTEPGKIRPVLIVQTNYLNKIPHPSTLVCPLTTKTITESTILRVAVGINDANLKFPSDILIDQIRAIDNQRFLQKIGMLPPHLAEKVRENIQIVLNL